MDEGPRRGVADREGVDVPERTCSVDECDSPVRNKGLCGHHHYEQWEKTARRCRIPECGRPFMARDLCSMHYRRWQKYGDPLTNPNEKAAKRPWTRTFTSAGDTVIMHVLHEGDETATDVFYDRADHELLSTRAWRISNWGYVVTGEGKGQGGGIDWMHRLVLGLEPGDPRMGDHINGRPIDNRRRNLRIVDNSINVANQRVVNHRGTSRYRGVTRHGAGWVASLTVDYQHIYVGYFPTEEEAADAVAARRAELDRPVGY